MNNQSKQELEKLLGFVQAFLPMPWSAVYEERQFVDMGFIASNGKRFPFSGTLKDFEELETRLEAIKPLMRPPESERLKHLRDGRSNFLHHGMQVISSDGPQGKVLLEVIEEAIRAEEAKCK